MLNDPGVGTERNSRPVTQGNLLVSSLRSITPGRGESDTLARSPDIRSTLRLGAKGQVLVPFWSDQVGF